jgi:hypothetical protein
MSYLMACLTRKEKNPHLAMITIGYIAVCIEGDIATHLPGIISFVRTSLPQNKVEKLKSVKKKNSLIFETSQN